MLAHARQRPDAVALRVDDDVVHLRRAERRGPGPRPRAARARGPARRPGRGPGAELGRVLHGDARVRPARGDRRAGEHPLQGRRGRVGRDRLRARPRSSSPATCCPRSSRCPTWRGLVVEDGWPAGHAARSTRRRSSATAGPRRWPTRRGPPAGPRAWRWARTTCAGVRPASSANRDVWGIGPGTVHLMVGPAYHAGPSYWAQMHLAIGATVVVMRRWDAETALGLIERWRVTTHAHGAGELPAHPRAARRRARPLRHLVAAARRARGGAVPGPAQARVHGLRRRRQGVGVLRRVGGRRHRDLAAGVAAEARAASASRSPVTGSWSSTTTATSCPPARSARCGSRPAGTSFEYHNDPEKTAAQYRGQFFTVGDAAYLDEDGYLFLADRKSDMVISGGVNIYPREIEECLLTHPEVVDCAVLGVPDDEWGEVLLAIVQPNAAGAADRGRRRRLGARPPRRLQAAPPRGVRRRAPTRPERKSAQAEAARGVPRGAGRGPRRVPAVHIPITRLDPGRRPARPGPRRRRRLRPVRQRGRASSRPAAAGRSCPTGLAVAIPPGYGGFVLPAVGARAEARRHRAQRARASSTRSTAAR